MNEAQAKRGGAPVGFVAELGEIEAASVIYLRLWSKGAAHRDDIRADLAGTLGVEQGERAMESFEQLCLLCGRHGRRPMMRHSLQCKCLGSDEACFANFIATAAEGDRDDAMLIATLLVRADVAPVAASLATDFGLALKRMNLAAMSTFKAANQPQATIH